MNDHISMPRYALDVTSRFSGYIGAESSTFPRELLLHCLHLRIKTTLGEGCRVAWMRHERARTRCSSLPQCCFYPETHPLAGTPRECGRFCANELKLSGGHVRCPRRRNNALQHHLFALSINLNALQQ